MNLTLRRAVFACALALGLGVASATGLQIVPDGDSDVTAGWDAYRSRDYAKALGHYRDAAARNQRVAQFNLAVMLLAGEGAARDPAAAVDWMKKSAQLGFARAQHALALLHERGEHVPRSLDDGEYTSVSSTRMLTLRPLAITWSRPP